MLGLAQAGIPVWLSASSNARRKLAYSLELAEVDLGKGPVLVGVNTSYPNTLAADAIAAGVIAGLAGYETLKREVRYGASSRIDILLQNPGGPPCYVEVKNVHLMRQPGLAEFPDSVTARGAKHLAELAAMKRQGCRAVMLFCVQRGDALSFALARDIDPAYAAAFEAAAAAGVEVLCYVCNVSPQGIAVSHRIPLAG